MAGSMNSSGAHDPGKPQGQPKKPVRKVKTFTCKNCGASVALRNPGGSLVAVCDSCRSVIDVTDENYQIIHSYIDKTKNFSPTISLGTRGDLFGKTWECIGYMVRKDVKYGVIWEEYLLFNPYYGYRWLTCNRGHWSFVKSIKEVPETSSAGKFEYAYLGKEAYKLFDRGRAETIYVIGEFYWRAEVGHIVNTEDYIAPPEMLSFEVDGNEAIWSIGTYLSVHEVAKAFKVPLKKFGPCRGMGPNQPSAATIAFKKMQPLWLLFCIILTCLQIWHWGRALDETVLQTTFMYLPNTKSKDTATTEVFTLKKSNANLQIAFNPSVDNSWFYASGELVNNSTGVSYPFEKTVEYYHGYDGGESWSEGSNTDSLTLNSIPNGSYYINYDYETGMFKDYNQRQCRLKVIRDVPTCASYFWSLLLVSILPMLWWFASRSDEVSRWSDSDFSPYVSSGDSE
ncbi:MAG: DUF4178 domain-containing protein [Candidatus Obscuribacterales bacterium]|nr:DUF4178 domain-containing protein [Candidatus Obscuribacterales bacterium]